MAARGYRIRRFSGKSIRGLYLQTDKVDLKSFPLGALYLGAFFEDLSGAATGGGSSPSASISRHAAPNEPRADPQVYRLLPKFRARVAARLPHLASLPPNLPKQYATAFIPRATIALGSKATAVFC
jgi:hypothetical protein